MFSSLFKKRPVIYHPVSMTKNGSGFSFDTADNQTILDAALLQGIPMPYSCQVGSCGECKCRIVSGDTRTIKDLGYMFDEKELAQGYTLACQTYAKSDLSLSFSESGSSTPATIVKSSRLDDNLYEISLELSGTFQANIGQYVQITNDAGLSRYYSIVQHHVTSELSQITVHVAIKQGGKMSIWWQDILSEPLHPSVQISPAQGRFRVQSDGDVIAIAGGSGLGVTAALVDNYLKQSRATSALLIGVFREGKSLYFDKTTTKLKKVHGDRLISLIVDARNFYESSPSQCVSWFGFNKEIERCSGLICGSDRLVAKGQQIYNEMGFHKKQVSYDEFV